MSRPASNRHWSGVLWLDEETIDGRRVAPQALTWTPPLPLRFMQEVGRADVVGTVEEVAYVAEAGMGVARGRTSIPPGSYAVGIDVRTASHEMDEDGLKMTVTGGKLSAVTITGRPAWQYAGWITVWEAVGVLRIPTE